MAGVSATDLETLTALLRDADRLVGDDPFPPRFLRRLESMIHGDSVSYSELDHGSKRVVRYVSLPSDDQDQPNYWRFAGEHPLGGYFQRTGDPTAVKISDFMTTRQFHASRIYSEFFQRQVEHMMAVGLPSPRWHTQRFGFYRAGGSDFGERERTLLNVLQPHLVALRRGALARQGLRTSLALVERRGDDGGGGVVLVGPAGEIRFAGPSARRMLERYFGERDRRVPEPLWDWMQRQTGDQERSDFGAPRGPFVVGRADRRLVVEVVPGTPVALLLREHLERDGAVLTPREREVMEHVGRGASNREIARLLGVSPLTVRKHLENVFSKLGARSRTEALALLRRSSRGP